MTVTAPKCKTCGKVEFRHLCSGPAPVREAAPRAPRTTPKAKPKKKAKRRP